jgi:hypothetical protein
MGKGCRPPSSPPRSAPTTPPSQRANAGGTWSLYAAYGKPGDLSCLMRFRRTATLCRSTTSGSQRSAPARPPRPARPAPSPRPAAHPTGDHQACARPSVSNDPSP